MSSRPAARRNKWVAPVLIALVCARMLDITDGSLTTPSSTSHHSEQKTEEQPVNGDFLAMSDVYTSSDTDNATLSSSYSKNFRVSRSEFNGVCANGECGGADVLRVVSQLAKRILGDPRVLGLRTGVPHSADNEDEAQAADEQSARAVGGGTSFDTRPFSSGDYYYDSNNYRNREGASDSYAMASNGNYRNRDRYANDASSSASYTDGQLASSNAYDRDGGYDSYGGDSYGGDGGYSGGGYDSYCCGQNNKLFPIFLVGLLGLLAFFLYLRSTTTTAAGRSGGLDDNDLSDVLLDGPTWLSLVHELWEQDGALENVACAQETLCRMNRLAMAAPGQAGWAVSFSSLPLSYLLHTRHTGGFTSYMDASLMGRSGVNCTELYSSCPRLH